MSTKAYRSVQALYIGAADVPADGEHDDLLPVTAVSEHRITAAMTGHPALL
jgi:hypothetical protein